MGQDGVVTAPVCENCGIDDPVLVSVRRVYVVPESWDPVASERIVPEAERWCVPCATQYPCEGAEA